MEATRQQRLEAGCLRPEGDPTCERSRRGRRNVVVAARHVEDRQKYGRRGRGVRVDHRE